MRGQVRLVECGGEAMETRLLIGGKEVSAEGGKTFERLNPVTGAVATRAAACSTLDAANAADAAFAAFPAWSEMRPSARRALLNKAADVLSARAAEFVSAMVDETASTSAWAHFNVMLAANMIRAGAINPASLRESAKFLETILDAAAKMPGVDATRVSEVRAEIAAVPPR